MDKFTVHTGTGLPLRRSNVDTDQIIPAEFLKRVTRTGFEDALFAAWRTEPDFVLNDARYAGASVLVAGTEFGIGSSREHAVWALHDYGFRVVLSSRFGDIFRGNSLKNGLLTVVLEQAVIERLWTLIEAEPATEITVDLPEPGGPVRRRDDRLRAGRGRPAAAAGRRRRHHAHAAQCRADRRVRAVHPGIPTKYAELLILTGRPVDGTVVQVRRLIIS